MKPKTLIYSIVLVLSFSKSFSQFINPKQLNDSTIFIGVIKEVSFISPKLNDCYEGSSQLISKGVKVAISGAKECYNLNFFEIFYQGKFYIIEKQNVIIEDSVFNKFLKFNYSDKSKFAKDVIQIIEKLNSKENLEVLKKLNSYKLKGIAYTYCDVYDESEFTDGTGVKFEIYNPTNKIIKYVWFTLVGINAVGDNVASKWGQKLTTLQGIGPIQPNEFESYQFEYTWFTDIVETARVVKIKVQFMDKTFKTVLNPKEVEIPNEILEKLEK